MASRSSPRGMRSRRATVTSARTGRKLATPWWMATPRSRSSTSYIERLSISSATAGCLAIRRPGRMSRESTTGLPSAVRTRSTTSTSDPGCSSRRAASATAAGSIEWPACSMPACIPAARIASVTPKFASRLLVTRRPSATNVPAPHNRRTSPSVSSARSASRSVARETPSSVARAGSDGRRDPAASTPLSIRWVSSARTCTLRGLARSSVFWLGVGGFGGLLIATVVIAIMYYGLVFSIAEMSPALPHTGGAYSFARSAFGPWGGFITGLAENMEYVITPAVVVGAMGFLMQAIVQSLFNVQGDPWWNTPYVWFIISYIVFVGINIRGIVATMRFTVAINAIALGNLAIGGGSKELGNSATPLFDGFKAVFGSGTGAALLALIGLVGLIASFFTIIYAYGRNTYSLSRAGYFPHFLSVTHPTLKTPHIALIAGGVVGLVLACLLTYLGTQKNLVAGQVVGALLYMAVFGGAVPAKPAGAPTGGSV